MKKKPKQNHKKTPKTSKPEVKSQKESKNFFFLNELLLKFPRAPLKVCIRLQVGVTCRGEEFKTYILLIFSIS